MSIRDSWQELKELGARRTAFRVGWELRTRLGVAGRFSSEPPRVEDVGSSRLAEWPRRLPFGDPVALADRLAPHVDAPALLESARAALQGKVLCFGAWVADFGDPPDWHLNPETGQRWDRSAYWTEALTDSARMGDVKLSWEIGRFPHAYRAARAAAFHPSARPELAAGLLRQMRLFTEENPYGRGLHWASGQEIVFRVMAWLFALDVLLSRSSPKAEAARLVADGLLAAAHHVEEHIDYARLAVYNNHLLSEALGLLIAGTLLPEAPAAARWRRLGRQILEEEAGRQFYVDGAYIQQSHNYHRVALQDVLWACLIARVGDDAPARPWLTALERSLDFLLAQQNPSDGRLPNYGSNDGALPCVLTSCDFADFRPTLQAVSLLTRGERVYPPGPWDEEAAWFLGPKALEAPLRDLARRSVSFAETGYHVLRGEDEGSFAALRCGSLRDRFSQIDMLQVDVWWRGLNVVVDAGSYLYNDTSGWHEHFMGTGSHNTLVVDDRDQMVHFRRFKVLYWTQARLLRFEERPQWRLAVGEHYGYRRHAGRCVHRRSVLMFQDDLWVVADTVLGRGRHAARLHWLCGEFPHSFLGPKSFLSLQTPLGPFALRAFDETATPLAGDVVRGRESPPRGWLSRYYARKVPVPSFAAEREGPLPMTILSVLGAGVPGLARLHGDYVVLGASGTVRFRLEDGVIRVAALA
jgi:asparagine synthase (glutamine-hydrolysing)